MSDLASQLREGTKQSHTLAENTAYMKCSLKGMIQKEPFRKLIANLYFVYRTLEAELLRHQDHSVVDSIYFPELNRQANLEQDLAFYYGENWQSEIASSEAGKTYVARLQEISNSEPALLVAHSYVRYLGDLSGGQGLKSIVRSALELPLDKGTRFYEFDTFASVGEIKEFKGRYRNALNSLPVDAQLIEKIVAEANNAFALNRDVMHALEPEVKAAIGENLFAKIISEEKLGSTESSSRENPENLATVE
ncbi:Heme oxygenase 2 [Hyella patelloides LEGE 07179]|uniref:heme oxygenase (biliverdin-producing) n=2 Tax=Hyella TaxID=945733 RepID=A0A563VL62_9CYAN|nr:heme oxygenase (biliverdin-producing) [Hyella patelloides]VEP12158.1 Heme oxygenase 2 [Hyella patelloides LEGE 07179]